MVSNSANSQPHANGGVPSSSTFSFKAPFPVSSATASALKHRRVSLASPSSPRIVQPWSFRDEMGLDAHTPEAASSSALSEKGRIIPEKKGKMRKIDSTKSSDEPSPPVQEKKPRKKWSQEETMVLVKGCQLHGVGNWKTILQDPDLKFHDRTAVDLKDRFRTYFPDAYKRHYPNARTHLSSKIRSTFPDGTSLFEKTRSKRRRPFTEAEDRALKAGYEKHGTVWATIVKDPIFQEQNRRSTDLRDRFRNAFPHLYQAAGYKPRSAAKKKVEGPMRAADDQSTTGPVRSRRRAQSTLRGGTKSVPQSTACSEDEESSAGEEDEEPSFKTPPMPVFVDNISTIPFRDMMKKPSPASTSNAVSAPTRASYMDADDEMDLITIETDSLNIPDFMPNETHSDMETWSSGINTPTHSSTAAWSTAAASPTSSHLSDFLMNATSGTSNNPSNASSPFINRRNDALGNGLIGKSAWGTQDWFSPNPRLDASSASSSTSSSSFIDASFSPASPFSFHPHLNHGVLDRYDLFPPSMPNDICSDAGLGDSHTTFSDERGAGGASASGASAGGTGFKGYHSQIAGDLISGAGARMHQAPFSSSSMSLSLANLYTNSFGSPFGNGAGEICGLGLEGIPEDTGIHPMQLHTHNPNLLGIDELGLTGISLNDHVDSSAAASQNTEDAMDDGSADNVLDMAAFGLTHSPENHRRSHEGQQQQQQKEKNEPEDLESSLDPFNLDDLVDMNNDLHATPPATPLMSQPRPMRRSSGSPMLHNFDNSGLGSGHARSISVPPSEARNGGFSANAGMPMSMDDVGLHMHSSHSHGHTNSQPEMNFGKSLQSLFNISPPPSSSSSSANGSSQQHQRHPNSEPMSLSNSTGSMQSPMSSPLHHQQHQQLQNAQPATLFPAHLMLSSASSSAISSSSSSHSHHENQSPNHDPWRLSLSSSASWMNPNSISSSDLYNVPYLDLHYATYGSMSLGQNHGGIGLAGLDGTLDDHSEARQGQALDLAQSAALASSAGVGLSGYGLNLSFGLKGVDSAPSPVGTIRPQHLSSGIGANKPASSSDSFVSVAAAATSVADDSNHSGMSSAADRASWTGTIRQSHIKNAGGGGALGRSMSHHRGQSAVCPQDLMLRNDNNKRKRASWDGGLV